MEYNPASMRNRFRSKQASGMDVMIYKLQLMIPYRKMTFIIQNMLSNRRITLFLNNTSSKEQLMKNGLPQGSVLAPLLFNIYTNDIPATKARKYVYADDMVSASQHKGLATNDI